MNLYAICYWDADGDLRLIDVHASDMKDAIFQIENQFIEIYSITWIRSI